MPDEYLVFPNVNPRTGQITITLPIQFFRDFDILDRTDRDPEVRRQKLEGVGILLTRGRNKWTIEPTLLSEEELERRRRRRRARRPQLAADGDG